MGVVGGFGEITQNIFFLLGGGGGGGSDVTNSSATIFFFGMYDIHFYVLKLVTLFCYASLREGFFTLESRNRFCFY